MADWKNPIAGDEIVRRARLIEAREARGLTRNALAEKLGLHRGYVGRVEEGLRNPSFQIMIRWVKFLNCSMDVFGNDASRAA